jgi:hypothetical protein
VVTDVADVVGGLVLLAVIGLVTFLARRTALRRGGATLNCGFRLDVAKPTRGWRTGMARLTPEDLEWFKLLSLSLQPKWTLVRRSVEVTGHREPHGAELLLVPHDCVVVACDVITRQGDPLNVELAMSEAQLTGFLAWLESAAPGAHSHPDRRAV